MLEGRGTIRVPQPGIGAETYQHLRLYGHVDVYAEGVHHAAHEVSPKYAQHVIIQTQEEARAARISLPAVVFALLSPYSNSSRL